MILFLFANLILFKRTYFSSILSWVHFWVYLFTFNRLWVHFACLWIISLYALYLLYKANHISHTLFFGALKQTLLVFNNFLVSSFFCFQEYDDILVKRIHQLKQIRHRPDQFTVLVREIPFCTEHNARACSADHFFSKYYPHDYYSYQILYNGKEVEVLMVWSEF